MSAEKLRCCNTALQHNCYFKPWGQYISWLPKLLQISTGCINMHSLLNPALINTSQKFSGVGQHFDLDWNLCSERQTEIGPIGHAKCLLYHSSILNPLQGSNQCNSVLHEVTQLGKFSFTQRIYISKKADTSSLAVQNHSPWEEHFMRTDAML